MVVVKRTREALNHCTMLKQLGVPSQNMPWECFDHFKVKITKETRNEWSAIWSNTLHVEQAIRVLSGGLSFTDQVQKAVAWIAR